MKILVLGGTLFLSKAVATEAIARGHDVTCAARGESGLVPVGARLVPLDRSAPQFGSLVEDWDAVVDVARTPSWVRDALAALADRTKHWTFISTINVYADDATPHGTPETLPLLEPIPDDREQTGPEVYGGNKVACEQAVQSSAKASLVIRPGLIAGPGDPSGRYSYWPSRLADGGEVLAPDHADRDVQLVDVRDLAAWIVHCAETGTTGVFDGTSPVARLGDVLAQTAAGVGAAPELTWVDPDFLVEREVNPWSGARSLPLWLPLPDYAGLLSHDVTASLEAGLRIRPIEETARDTLAWLRDNPDEMKTGLTRAEERQVLEDWHTIRA